MTRDNVLFAIIGVLLGFIIGFMLHGVMSERDAARRPSAAAQQGQSLPPDHPPIGSDSSDGAQQTMMQVQEAMKQAREQPNNFEAQVTAAKLEYQIQRFDQAIEYLLVANKLRPADAEVVAMLAEANMDAKHWDAATKWYKAALVKRPNDLTLLDGYAFVLLQSGDAKGAEDAINKLAKLDPANQDLPQFRAQLVELESSKSK